MFSKKIFCTLLQLLSVTLCAKKILDCSNILQHYIIDTKHLDTDDDDAQDMLNAGEPEKILEISEFSMLRLHDIAEQRHLYSSVDDIVYAHDSDSDFDEPYENSKSEDLPFFQPIVYHRMHKMEIIGKICNENNGIPRKGGVVWIYLISTDIKHKQQTKYIESQPIQDKKRSNFACLIFDL